MRREQRLRSPADFRRVRDLAPRGWAHPLLVLYCAANDLGRTRVGITVSSRVGNAVVRNRVRRRLREALRERFVRLPQGADILVTARPASATATWAELCMAIDVVLNRAAVSQQ
ncbi:MAG: ribonuclease P protein component [Chloroflexi bacterium]|nr:ribonuclease P protein component [Chloroflexota bacterium]MBV9899371.1 ribonuclease P protein component [Chloroflexota bacterium]